MSNDYLAHRDFRLRLALAARSFDFAELATRAALSPFSPRKMKMVLAVLALCCCLVVGLTESGQKALFLGLCFGRVVVELYIVKVLVSDRFGSVKGVSVQ